MSGFSDVTNCPNCGNEAQLYMDHKPFDYVSIECYECGFIAYTNSEYLTLDQLNSFREEQDLEPLSKLPDQDETLIST